MSDLQFGTHNENVLFPTICREFGEDLKKTTGWATFDYEDGRTQVELKSRRCCKNRYPTTVQPLKVAGGLYSVLSSRTVSTTGTTTLTNTHRPREVVVTVDMPRLRITPTSRLLT